MKERDYYLAFSLVSGIGPKTFISFHNYFKSAEKAWNASFSQLRKAGLSEKLIKSSKFLKSQFTKKGNVNFQNLPKEELKVVQLLANENLGFDETVSKLKLDPAKAGSLLSMMEIKGLITSTGDRSYSLD